MKILIVACASALCLSLSALAETVEYSLHIERGTVNFTGKDRPAMMINGGIPGPTLKFTDGDDAIIHVENRMDVDTSIHWHGLLLPPNMDGVPYVTNPPIEPGKTATFKFRLRQSGTYWYHSHTGDQEQRGIYGSIVIRPKRENRRADRDEVVLLSDWTDEDPHEVLRTLKRGSEWYAIKKKSAQSVLGAAKHGSAGSFFKRELNRMPPMDIADVYYDRFLANGETEHSLEAKAGETVRLRVIDGSATTFFYLNYAGGPMTVVAADGIDVRPFELDRLLVGVAETYDVLVEIPGDGSFEFRATAHDGSGHASVWLGDGERHPAADVPLPNLYHTMGGISLRGMFAVTPAASMGMGDRAVKMGMFDKPGMMGMGDMNMADPGGRMDHVDMEMAGANREMETPAGSATEYAIDGMDPRRPFPPYDQLRALHPTAFDKSKPRRDIRLTLDGDMERYVWYMNNKALSESDAIKVRSGEVTRFILINRTMMHHPMHLHGQFFRVVNAQGDYSPLKHTVDVPPMTTTVIEIDGSEAGDWFFHCHLLYHMKTGMARVVHYEGFEPDAEIQAIRHELYEDPWYLWAEGAALSHMTEGNLTLSNTRNILNAGWEIGWGNVEETEYEIDLTWGYSLNRFSGVFAGAQLTNNEIQGDRGIFGVSHVLPLLVDAYAWVDTEGDFRVGAVKSIPITPRLGVFGEVQYDTATDWEWATGAEYIISNRLSVIGQYHSEYGAGAGIGIRF